MWDSNALLQLLKSMPNKLSKENLEKIQLVIDADKYKNSLLSGFDLCDMYMYAPFCQGCKKTSIYPCAIAYVNMMRAQGIDVEIDARPVGTVNTAFEPKPMIEEQAITTETIAVEDKEENQEQAVEEIAVTLPVEEAETIEKISAEPKIDEVKEQAEELRSDCVPSGPAVKRKIRIAVARKRI